MRTNHNPYRNEPKVIAISVARKHVLLTLSWNLALASLLYALCLGLLH